MTEAPSDLIVVCPKRLGAGFRLAGAATQIAEDAGEAEQVVKRLLAEGQRGVIAIYGPLFQGIEPGMQAQLRGSVAPVVIELPTGESVEPEEARRTRLAQRLQRAIGFHVSFGEEES